MARSGRSCSSALSQRWIYAVMSSIGSMNVFTMRSCLSLALTEIVATKQFTSNTTNFEDALPGADSVSTSSILSTSRTYEWDEYTQGLILSSFYWGYLINQIPSIYLVNRFGGKWLYGLGVLSTSCFTLLTPLVIVTYGSTGLILIRAIMGVGEAATSPAACDLIARWSPPDEISKITTLVMSGLQVGTILGTALSGVLIKYSSTGWPMAFYVFGTIGVLWFFAWTVLVYNNPEEHPFISQKEKDYLRESMKGHVHNETQPIPWRHIVTSVPAWAFLSGRIAQEWIFPLMIVNLPKYMSDVLKFSVDTNGFLLALPNAVMWLLSILFSWLADWLIKTNRMSRKNVRKIFATMSTVGPAVLLVGASYAEYDYTMVVILFTASMGMMGAFYSGIMVNSADLSPNHSGTLISVTSIIGSLCGLLVPYTIGVVTPNHALLEWRIVFWITFFVLCGTGLIFNIWGDAEVQYWNDLNSLCAKRNSIELTERDLFIQNTDSKVKLEHEDRKG